jgi:hypothetical protein
MVGPFLLIHKVQSTPLNLSNTLAPMFNHCSDQAPLARPIKSTNQAGTLCHRHSTNSNQATHLRIKANLTIMLKPQL